MNNGSPDFILQADYRVVVAVCGLVLALWRLHVYRKKKKNGD